MATKNGLRIYPEKKSGKFKYRVVMDYFHPYEEKWKQVTCGTHATTKKVLDDIKNQLSQKVEKILGEYNKKKVDLTIKEALAEWYKFRKGSIAEGTYIDDVAYTKSFKATYGKWKLARLEKDHLKTFLMNLEVSPNSRKNFRSKLNLFLTFCEDEGYLEENPMYRVRLPKHKETLEEKEKREDKFFTVEEMGKLLEAMKVKEGNGQGINAKNSRRKRLMVEFQFSLGGRISEATGLRYKNIDFELGILRLQTQFDVHQSTAKTPKVRALKTQHSERELLLKDRELEILQWFKSHNHTKSDFIFVQENGYLIGQALINDFLKKFCEVLPYKLRTSFVSHALRHGNVMLKKELGIDEQVIVREGGWSDTQMISRVYGRHLSPHLAQQANQKMKGFSVENSRNIHKKTEETQGLRRTTEKGAMA